ncbi:MAG: hypothetical protein JSW52_10595, partial [Candidatus Coatesbacteria bacterium]
KKEDKMKYISESFDLIRSTVIAAKESEISDNKERLEEVDIYVYDMKYRLDSALIGDDIEVLKIELSRLYNDKMYYESDINYYSDVLRDVESGNIDPEYPWYESADVLNARLETIEERIDSIDKEIEDKEKEKSELENRLEKAQKNEAEKPVWESAVFIVIAFFSGYSLNFVTKMFDRAMTAIISGKPGETEMEGEAPPEPEGGGEEAVG